MPGGTFSVRGLDVEFPFAPYPSQLIFMEKVIETLQRQGTNALLESPTGTGKTLCLLCATLAWRQALAAFFQAQRASVIAQDGGSAMLDELAIAAFGTPDAPDLQPANGTAAFDRTPPRIIYMSRTHGQLSQVIRELRNTKYRPRTSVLGSRQQFCVHPEVSKLRGAAQNTQCQKLVGANACKFHNKTQGHKAEHPEVLTDMMDIEDLGVHGNKHTVCPYYLTRDTAGDADIVFMPYNYLTDPGSRRSLSYLWADSVVIFDEAHNMESICAESASFDITSKDLALCINEVERCAALKASGVELSMTDGASEQDLLILKAILLQFESVIDSLPLQAQASRGGPPNPPSVTKGGDFIYEMFAAAGVKADNASDLTAMVDRTMGMLAEAQGASLSADPALRMFRDAVSGVFKASDIERIGRLYKVHVSEVQERPGARNAGRNSITAVAPGVVSGLRKPRSLGFWCFSAGVTMRDIVALEVRNIMFASGTLSPMTSWEAEMEIPFEVQLENKHVIGDQQLMAGVVRKGPMGHALNSSYQTRETMEYKRDLGALVLNVSRVVPDGLLVFFPSYAALASAETAWKEGPQWDQINRHKEMFVEPRDSASFKSLVAAYGEALDRPNGGGAVLLAVCRGKMSEGIDFADKHGRCVIVTGIPFPAVNDPRVTLKRAFLDELKRGPQQKGGQPPISGELWYKQQAARAVNQAVGRVIRHRNDFGAILLADERFAAWPKQALLSKWMSPKVQTHDSFGAVAQQLSAFFRHHREAQQRLLAEAGPPQEPQPVARGVVEYEDDRAPRANKSRRGGADGGDRIAASFDFMGSYMKHKDGAGGADAIGAGAAAAGGTGKFGLDDLDDAPASVPHQKQVAEVAPAVGAHGKSLSEQLMSLHAPTTPAAKSSGGGIGARSTPAAPRSNPFLSAVEGGGLGSAPAARSNLSSAAKPAASAVGGGGGGPGGTTCRALEPRPAAETNQDKGRSLVVNGSAKAEESAVERHKTFLVQAKKRLGQVDYLRFKDVVHRLKATSGGTQVPVFEELHSLLASDARADIMRQLLMLVGSKVRAGVRAFFAEKYPASVRLLPPC